MDAYQAIITKRDLRDYDTRPIPDDVLQRILQAGRMAGSSSNSQPVRYVVLTNRDTIKALKAFGRGTRQLEESPLYILAFLQDQARHFDVGRAFQNMMVAAWADGVLSCPVGLQDLAPVNQTLGVPDDWKLSIGIAFGYPAPATGTANPNPRPRLAADELYHMEKW